MAVAVFGSLGTGSGAVDPLDHNHVIAGEQSNVLLVAGTAVRSSRTVDEVRWDPTGANQLLVEAMEATGGTFTTALCHFKNPANQDGSTKTLRHDFDATAVESTGAGLNFSGVDQTTPVKYPNSNVQTTGNPSVSVTTDAVSDDLVLDGIVKHCGGSGTITQHASQALRWDLKDTTRPNHGGSTEAGGTNPTSMDWTFTGGDNNFCAAGMLIKAAAAAPKSLPPISRITRNVLLRM